MRTIEVDANQRELSPHGTLLYPLEINHDDLSTFQNGFVRCHWHEELELSIVRSGRACYTLGGGVHVLQAGEGILINANVPHTSAPFGSAAASTQLRAGLPGKYASYTALKAAKSEMCLR